jgi:hypothetical protein
LDVITSVSNIELPTLQYFPNPVISYLNLKNIMDYQQVFLYDLQGKNLGHYQIQGNDGQIDLQKYPKGLYVLKLIGRANQPSKSIKIFKD